MECHDVVWDWRKLQEMLAISGTVQICRSLSQNENSFMESDTINSACPSHKYKYGLNCAREYFHMVKKSREKQWKRQKEAFGMNWEIFGFYFLVILFFFHCLLHCSVCMVWSRVFLRWSDVNLLNLDSTECVNICFAACAAALRICWSRQFRAPHWPDLTEEAKQGVGKVCLNDHSWRDG